MRKKVLVTAGSTMVPIDQVRGITNIFKGKTGTAIAEYFSDQGCDVTLLTSNLNIVSKDEKIHLVVPRVNKICVLEYKTFDQLLHIMRSLLSTELSNEHFDIVIHSAAVSDYKVQAVCTKDNEGKLKDICSDKKVSSEHSELYLRLEKTQKIIDLIKGEWGFKGALVKFKLQVGCSDEELLSIAEKSMIDSSADFIVANCLEWATKRAYILGTKDEIIEYVHRDDLSRKLYRRLMK